MTPRIPEAALLTPVSVPARPQAVALVLHGGRSESHDPTTPFQLAVLRLTWLARAVAPALRRHGVATYRLRFSVRGWNGGTSSVPDARVALARLHDLHPGVPVVLVGHSMGGRTALAVADDPAVVAVVALAPWIEPGEPVGPVKGRDLVVAHGLDDRVTSPKQSQAFAERARGVASSVVWIPVPEETHGMVRHARTWHRIVRDAVVRVADAR